MMRRGASYREEKKSLGLWESNGVFARVVLSTYIEVRGKARWYGAGATMEFGEEARIPYFDWSMLE